MEPLKPWQVEADFKIMLWNPTISDEDFEKVLSLYLWKPANYIFSAHELSQYRLLYQNTKLNNVLDDLDEMDVKEPLKQKTDSILTSDDEINKDKTNCTVKKESLVGNYQEIRALTLKIREYYKSHPDDKNWDGEDLLYLMTKKAALTNANKTEKL